jgi:TonB family protein
MPAPAHAPAHPPAAAHPPAHGHVEPAARDAAAGFTFHKDEPTKSKAPLIGGLAAVLLIGVAAAYFLLGRNAGQAPPGTAAAAPASTLSPEAVAAMARVKELEAQLLAIEAEKAAATAKAEEDAKKKVEAQAAARGQAVDPAALEKAQNEARARAQAEQEKKQQEEKRRLEEEQKAAEARLAEERRKAAEEEAARLAAAATTTVPVTAPPVTVPAVRPGALVDVNEPGVIAPIALSKASLQYPPIALRQRIDGTVDLSVLVDEKGAVTDARVTSGAGGKAGLNEAAVDYVRRWKFRPASKDGVNVKVWTPVSVKFVLPKG